MSPVVLFLVVAMAGITTGIVWTALDAAVNRGARGQTADRLFEIAETLGTIEAHLHNVSDHTRDTFGVAENVETDVRALRDTVDAMANP